VVEKVDVLLLEVRSIEIQKLTVRTGKGGSVTVDYVAQVKIKGDDTSILAATEHFLSKSHAEIKNIVRPVLEKHLSSVLGSSSIEEAT
jgi:flotillin